MIYSGMLSPRFILAERATVEQSDRMAELAAEAKANWLQEGHPGWSVTPADSQDFIARVQQVQVSTKYTLAGRETIEQTLVSRQLKAKTLMPACNKYMCAEFIDSVCAVWVMPGLC